MFGTYRRQIYNCKMSQNSAPVLKNKFFRQETLSFEEIPHQSKLFNDFQANSAKTSRFYPEKQTSVENFAAKVLENYKTDRAALCDILITINKSFGAGDKTFENIQMLRDKDCLVTVTGQQAGLFTGSLYTIYKALSAIKLAEKLKNENLKVVPVFWIAEEDHDFDEVKKTFNLDKAGKFFESENTPKNYQEKTPVGLVYFDESVAVTIDNLFNSIPHTEFTDEVKSLVINAYQKGETYSTAFGKLLTRFFADFGLIILSPLDKELKKLSAPILHKAIEKSGEIASALIQRSAELKKENYQPQVLVTEDYYPFFFQNENGERQALRKNLQNERIKVQNSKAEYEQAELMEAVLHSPERLSPNALMRPVVQDFLLPTLAYFGGAAEIAYFAQNSVIYEILNRPVTPIRHRASFTVVERKHLRTMEKYQLKFSNLFEGQEKVSAEIVEKFLNKEMATVFDEVETSIAKELDRLNSHLSAVEATLAQNLTNRRRKILWHINALRNKYHRAEISNNEIVHRRIENLFTALLPNNALQERTINALTFLNLCGDNFIDWIYEAIEPDEIKHRILYL